MPILFERNVRRNICLQLPPLVCTRGGGLAISRSRLVGMWVEWGLPFRRRAPRVCAVQGWWGVDSPLLQPRAGSWRALPVAWLRT